MLQIVEERGGWVELRASGRLRRADYHDAVARLEQRLEREGRLSALIVLEDFEGWTLAAALEGLRFDLRDRRGFVRLVVVGERRLEALATRFSAPFFSGSVRFFDREDEARAREWSLEPERRAAASRASGRRPA